MRILVYGDSNSWGFPPDASGIRFDTSTRWPAVMAHTLNATVIEDCLPGRTTVHDDPELNGSAMNGLAHLPVALLSQTPIDLLLIMLGTNDFKAQFHPDAAGITHNIGRLLDCVNETGGGIGPWSEGPSPRVAIIVPPPLPPFVDSYEFERKDEWIGGRSASVELLSAVQKMAKSRGVAVFDAGSVVCGAPSDPIHLDADSQIVLGRAVASWLQKMHEPSEMPVQKHE